MTVVQFIKQKEKDERNNCNVKFRVRCILKDFCAIVEQDVGMYLQNVFIGLF